MGLGPVHTVPLAAARNRATECRALRLQGIDPIEHRLTLSRADALATARSITFDECSEAYIAAHQAAWRHVKHRQQWINSLARYVSPVFGAVPVAAVDVGLVMKALEPIWTKRPQTAGRVRGRIEAVLDWAKARGFRDGENPARWRGHLSNLLARPSKLRAAKHYPALPFAEVGDFMADLRSRTGVSVAALEFVILTAARTVEVTEANWKEIDWSARTWTIPAERMKGGREHRVPLSLPALMVLERMKNSTACAVGLDRYTGLIFLGDGPDRRLGKGTLLKQLERMGRPELTVHGFRSTFRDWAAERTNFPSEVVEMALAHVVSNKVEAAYRRGDLFEKRRALMEAWAQFCCESKAGNVVAFGRN
jgi:integrase